MSHQNNNIRSRYKRDKSNPRPGRFQTPGDAEIILLIHEYRYLTRPLIELLTGRQGTTLKRRLRFLFDNGYLWKVQFSRSYTDTGSTPDIYVLDKKGQEAYNQITGQVADQSPKRNLNKDPQLEHSLLINTIRAIITNVCNNRDDVDLIYWQRSGKLCKDTFEFEGKSNTIAPDGFFVLKQDGGRSAPFFLEADRSTMDQPTFTKKLQAYFAYYKTIRSELDSQRGSVKKEVSNSFNIHGFRVLTVIETDHDWQLTRHKNRLADLIESGFKATDNKGWRGFWFTNKNSFHIKHPESFLKSIWKIAHPEEVESIHSLLR